MKKLLTIILTITVLTLAAIFNWHGETAKAKTAGGVTDCDKIAFYTLGGELIVMNSDGSGRMRIGDSSLSVTDPVISPNGRLVAFVGSRGGQQDLYIVGTDGTGQLQLTSDLETFNYQVGSIAFSSDSSRITFMAERDQDGRDEVHRACKANCVTVCFTNKESVAPQTRWRSDSSPVSNFESALSIFRRQPALPNRRPLRLIRPKGKLFAFSSLF